VKDADTNKFSAAGALSRRLFFLATPSDAGVCLHLGRRYFDDGHYDKARLGLDVAGKAGQFEII